MGINASAAGTELITTNTKNMDFGVPGTWLPFSAPSFTNNAILGKLPNCSVAKPLIPLQLLGGTQEVLHAKLLGQ